MEVSTISNAANIPIKSAEITRKTQEIEVQQQQLQQAQQTVQEAPQQEATGAQLEPTITEGVVMRGPQGDLAEITTESMEKYEASVNNGAAETSNIDTEAAARSNIADYGNAQTNGSVADYSNMTSYDRQAGAAASAGGQTVSENTSAQSPRRDAIAPGAMGANQTSDLTAQSIDRNRLESSDTNRIQTKRQEQNQIQAQQAQARRQLQTPPAQQNATETTISGMSQA
jgi:hypothetical protein